MFYHLNWKFFFGIVDILMIVYFKLLVVIKIIIKLIILIILKLAVFILAVAIHLLLGFIIFWNLLFIYFLFEFLRIIRSRSRLELLDILFYLRILIFINNYFIITSKWLVLTKMLRLLIKNFILTLISLSLSWMIIIYFNLFFISFSLPAGFNNI